MKGRFRISSDDNQITRSEAYSSYDHSYVNKPVRSPSPDKKAANIITSTRSPQITEIKRHLTPLKDEHFMRDFEIKEKQFQQSFTPRQEKEIYARNHHTKNEETAVSHKIGSGEEKISTISQVKYGSPNSNSRTRNMKIEIVTEYAPQDYESRPSDRDRESRVSGEFDYARMLRSKQETIRELREIIEMIKRSNDGFEENDDDGRLQDLQRKLSEYKNQNTTLLIENQKLLNIIENNQIKMSPSKEQILNRQNKELKESLRDKELELEDMIKTLHKRNQELEDENERLLKMMKERESQQRLKTADHLANSAYSQPAKSSVGGEKDRMTLTKIKEQHQQNLKLMQENFYRDLEQLEFNYQNNIDEISKKLQTMEKKLSQFELMKSQIDSKQLAKSRKDDPREENHKQKERHQEIESLLLQKYSKYEKELSQQRRANEILSLELSRAHQSIDELQNKSLSYSQQISHRSRMQDKEDETLQRLNNQRADLIKHINDLEEELNRIKREIQDLAREKDRKVAEAQSKLEVIMMEYQSKIKEERKEYNHIINRLERNAQDFDKKYQEALENFEKDKNDTEEKVKQAIDLYNKEMDSLKLSNIHKNNEILNLSEENDKLREELGRLSTTRNDQSDQLKSLANECNQLRTRCGNLERNVEQLSEELTEMEANLNEKENAYRRLETERYELQDDLRKTKTILVDHANVKNEVQDLKLNLREANSNKNSLQSQIDQLQKKLRDNEINHYEQIAVLQKENTEKNQYLDTITSKLTATQADARKKSQELVKVSSLYENMRKQRSTFNYETLEDELRELKRLVNEYQLKRKSKYDGEIIEEYYRLIHQHELKIEENLKLLKEIEEYKIQLGNEQRERLMLNEKISMLENNIAIYEREQKERKLLYEMVLQQKTRIEKEAFLSKKIKAEKSNFDQSMKSNVLEITSRIDRIMDLERDRAEKWQRSEEY